MALFDQSNEIPKLMTPAEVAVALHRCKFNIREFIWRELVPLGCVVKVGGKLMVHAWGIHKYLRDKTIDPKHDKIATYRARHAKNVDHAKQLNARLRKKALLEEVVQDEAQSAMQAKEVPEDAMD